MKLPFDFDKPNFEEDARIKFTFTSPELHQNIEISIDGTELSVDALLETFERFLGALGISIPNDVVVGFIRVADEEGDEEEDDEDGDGDGDGDQGDDGPEIILPPSKSNKKNKDK